MEQTEQNKNVSRIIGTIVCHGQEAVARIQAHVGVLPALVLPALLIAGDKTKEGELIKAVAVPSFEIVRLIQESPDAIYRIGWRKWEEIIAGAYERGGYDVATAFGRGGRLGVVAAAKVR